MIPNLTKPPPSSSEHVYLSTACTHGHHDYCQSTNQGNKIPAECKFCAAPCICSCHEIGDAVAVDRSITRSWPTGMVAIDLERAVARRQPVTLCGVVYEPAPGAETRTPEDLA